MSVGVEFLVIGDPHKDGEPSFLPDDLRDSAFKQVSDQALSYCLEHGIKRIIWLGDVFHSYPPSLKAQEQVIEIDNELAEHGIQLYIIDGNHGYVRKGHTSLNLLKRLADMRKMNAKIYTSDTTIEEVEGEDVAFMPWPNKDISMLTKPSLIFAHIDKPGAKLANGHVMEGIEDFDMGEHEWIIGHNHTPQPYYCGAPLPLRWGDTNKRRFWHVRFKNGKAKKRSVLIDNPYNLEDYYANTEEELAVLDTRESNTWTRLFLGGPLLSQSKEIQDKYPRVVCKPVPKKVFIDGNTESNIEVSEDGNFVFMDETQFEKDYLSRKADESGFSSKEKELMNSMLKEIA